MSMTLLEAAKAKLEGKRVEVWVAAWWTEWLGTSWGDKWEVRIAPEPKKKVKLLAYLSSSGLIWHVAGRAIHSSWQRVPSEDKEVEIET